MKTTIFSLLFTFIVCNAFAQTETPVYKTVADKFAQHYNNENFDSIFSMFDIVLQGLRNLIVWRNTIDMPGKSLVNHSLNNWNCH